MSNRKRPIKLAQKNEDISRFTQGKKKNRKKTRDTIVGETTVNNVPQGYRVQHGNTIKLNAKYHTKI